MAPAYRIPQLLDRARQQRPMHVATRMDDRSRTWAEFHDRVRRLAAGYRALGAVPGDRIALLALNADRYLETLFASAWAGMPVVPLNTRLAAAEIADILADCRPAILVVDTAFQAVAGALPASCRPARTISLDNAPGADGQAGHEALIADHAPAAETGACGDDLAGIYYTGGTTGRAKGVMLSHANLVANAFNTIDGMGFDRDTNVLHAAPMFHLADGMNSYAVTALGGSHCFVPRFTPDGALEAIARYRATHAAMVPTMLNMLSRAEGLERYDLSSMRQINFGAAPMQDAVFRRVREKFPDIRLLHGYGMTEAAPLLTVLPAAYNTLEGPLAGRLSSCGLAVLGVELRIVDAQGREVAPGRVGEIAARGPNVMLGYWNRPEETAKVLRDGWLMTGDGAYMDAEGFVFIVDRLKDMIVSGGENVYSAEVENAIAAMEGVAEVAVFGIPDPQWGEAVHATVVPAAGAVLTPEAVIAHCRTAIAGYKCPRSVQIRDQAMPVSGAGKILKTELRRPFWEGQARGVA